VLELVPVELAAVETVEVVGLEVVFATVTSESAPELRAEFDDVESEPLVEDTGLIALLQTTEGISCCADTS